MDIGKVQQVEIRVSLNFARGNLFEEAVADKHSHIF